MCLKCRLLLVPTAEAIGREGLPGPCGKLRLGDAAQMLRAGEAMHIATIGYEAGGPISGAEGYANWFKETCPDLKNAIAFFSGTANCSNHDIPNAQGKLDTYFGVTKKRQRRSHTIGIVSERQHARRIKRVLRRLGYKSIIFPTAEEPHFGLMGIVLDVVTVIDPFWSWLGLPLVIIANRRCYDAR